MDSQTTTALWGFQKLVFELNFDERISVAWVAPPFLQGFWVMGEQQSPPRVEEGELFLLNTLLFLRNFIFLWFC